MFLDTGLLGTSKSRLPLNKMLYDHRPLKLNVDDHERVCRIPKEKVLIIFF
jgi:DNA (cytosine-5)-methyltransferase 1